MNKIIFFGLGGVARVMSQCFYDLFQNKKEEVNFVFICRNIESSKKNLFNMSEVFAVSTFVEIDDFNLINEYREEYKDIFRGAIGVVNSSSPKFNNVILEFSLALGSNYCDLSSDIYSDEFKNDYILPQYKYDSKFKDNANFALVNAGISPGITNFLIGEKIYKIDSQNDERIESIKLFLLENITSSEIIFSWSPKQSFEELEEKPNWVENNEIVSIQPFANSTKYKFPHYKEQVYEYPIFQEELISLHKTFPSAKNIRAYSGGSEVELIKNLFQLNLLSKDSPACINSDISIEEIITSSIPRLKTPEELSILLRNNKIKSAEFAAIIEIEKEDVVEVTGLSFNHYLDLLNTPYEGATYISYPAGIGAAIMFFYTYRLWKDDSLKINGILSGEELSHRMDNRMIIELKSELVRYGIDLISHSHSFKFCKSKCLSVVDPDL